MSLSTAVANAVARVNSLYDLVKGQYDKWTILVNEKILDLENWKINFINNEYKKDIGVALNMIKNPTFTEGPNGLSGWHGNGVRMEVVHEYTKGFSTPYTSTKNDNHTDDISLANEDNPYWNGNYNCMPEIENFGGKANGSINNGWDNFPAKILKVSYDGSNKEHRYFAYQRLFNFIGNKNKAKFSAFVFIQKGSLLMGDHAGYRQRLGNKEITTQKKWVYAKIETNLNSGTGGKGNFHKHMFGFKNGVESEVYIVLPNLTYLENGNSENILIQG